LLPSCRCFVALHLLFGKVLGLASPPLAYAPATPVRAACGAQGFWRRGFGRPVRQRGFKRHSQVSRPSLP